MLLEAAIIRACRAHEADSKIADHLACVVWCCAVLIVEAASGALVIDTEACAALHASGAWGVLPTGTDGRLAVARVDAPRDLRADEAPWAV